MSGQELEQRTPVETAIVGIRSEVFKQQVEMALPPSVTPARFQRIAITALQENAEELARCEPNSIIRALLRCAADGLLPDRREAAIVRRGDQAVYQSMVGGLRKIAGEYGWTIRARAVRAADTFEYLEQPPAVSHQVARPGVDRGEIIAAYAVATHRDGRVEFKVMYADAINKRRALATTQKVWDKWPDEMAEKTVARDLVNDLPLADADREHLSRVYAASSTDPVEASALIYGPTATPAALPPAGVRTDHPLPQADGVDAGGQQAVAAPPPEAATATGPDDDEPSLEDEPAPTSFQAPPSVGVDDDSIVIAAQHAALYKPPNGAHKDMTLSEILAVGAKGESWFRNRLEVVTAPPEYVQALWNFCRVYAPEIFQAALAKREAEAA